MPTSDIIATNQESDATAWCYAKPEKNPAGEIVAMIVTCKACEASMRYVVTLGGVFGEFKHVNACPVLKTVKGQHKAHLDRASVAAAKERG